MREEVAELLANKKDLLTITYFKLQKLFEKKSTNIINNIYCNAVY